MVNGEKGSISCYTDRNHSLLWRSKPDDVVIANGNLTKNKNYKVVGNPPGMINLLFTANISSTPPEISCSEPRSANEWIFGVVVLG